MISSNVVIPEDPEQLALTINRKKRNIRRKNFMVLADAIGITQRSADKMIEKIEKMESKYIEMCKESYMPDDTKEALEALIHQRMEILK